MMMSAVCKNPFGAVPSSGSAALKQVRGPTVRNARTRFACRAASDTTNTASSTSTVESRASDISDDDLKEELARKASSLEASVRDVSYEETSTATPETGGESGASTSKFSGSLKGMLLLNVGALLFGSNQVVIKTAEEVLTPYALDALRFGAAALCFIPFLPAAFSNKRMLRPSLELGTWLTAGYTAQAFGLAQTSASHGAFTGTFTVLAVPILVGLSGRRIANRTWFAAMAGLLGVSLLTTSDGQPNIGDLWCVMSAILFGVHKWRSESITSSFAQETTELVALQLLVLAGASCILCIPELMDTYHAVGVSGLQQAALDLPWLSILFMGVGTTAVTLWIEMSALQEVSAPLAALIYTAEPLWGAAFAWVLLDERWGGQGWVGAFLILAASLFSQIGGDPAEKALRASASTDKTAQ